MTPNGHLVKAYPPNQPNHHFGCNPCVCVCAAHAGGSRWPEAHASAGLNRRVDSCHNQKLNLGKAARFLGQFLVQHSLENRLAKTLL